jgi:uncharacterized transporter YbjL
MIGYTVALWLTALIAGLLLAIVVFVTFFLWAEARLRLRSAVIGGVATGALTMAAFHVMKIDHWAGIMPELVPGYLGGSIMPLL